MTAPASEGVDALLAKATPRPWRVSDDNPGLVYRALAVEEPAVALTDDEDDWVAFEPDHERRKANAALIVALVNGAERARAERDALEKENARLRAALSDQRDRWEQLPGGVDYEADPANLSPEDSAAHIGGLAIQAIDGALGDDAMGRG